MKWFAILISGCIIFTSALATPIATIVNAHSISPQENCGFAEDNLNLIVSNEGKKLASYHFCSNYGNASVQIIADKKKVNYILLRNKEGRGPNAATEYLSVFRLGSKFNDELLPLIRTPISSAAGMTSRWYYDYKINTPQTGGIKFILTRRIENSGDANVDYFPSELIRVIDVNAD